MQSLYSDSVVLIDDARLYLSAPPRPQECADWPDFHSVISALLPLSSGHRLLVLNDVIIFYPERIAAPMREFAHNYGVDWLLINHQLHAYQAARAQEEERRAQEEQRRAQEEKVRAHQTRVGNFFRRLWHKSTKSNPNQVT